MQIKISAIIPAHNEAGRISNVLSVLHHSNLFNEILVIDDNSTDDTAGEVKDNFPSVKIFRKKKSNGKANAMLTGVKKAKNPLLFFCDADLTGLNKNHLQMLINPIVKGKLRMSVGAQEYMVPFKKDKSFQNFKKFFNNFGGDGRPHLNEFVKGMGGERVMYKSDFLPIKNLQDSGYGVEQKINLYFLENNLPFQFLVLQGVSHFTKIDKWGVAKGSIKQLGYLLSAGLNYIKYLFLKFIKFFK